jgi:hypothetical protein
MASIRPRTQMALRRYDTRARVNLISEVGLRPLTVRFRLRNQGPGGAQKCIHSYANVQRYPTHGQGPRYIRFARLGPHDVYKRELGSYR